jgi:uncharacterized protein (DUF983 family)
MTQFAFPTPRSWKSASLRGFAKSCPACGKGQLYGGFLQVNPVCSDCGLELHHQRADDAPPYLTIFIVGHIIVPLMLLVEKVWHPELWIHSVLWLPLTLFLSLWLLPRIKGAVIGLQWAFGMHGFAPAAEGETGALTPAP